MRKVLFAPLQQNGFCSKEITEPGLFHQWGTSIYDNGQSANAETLAVIETRSGKIEMIPPHAIKFIEPVENMWDGRPVLIFHNNDHIRIAGSDKVLFFCDDMDQTIIALIICMFNDGRAIDEINDFLQNTELICNDHREIILECFYNMH